MKVAISTLGCKANQFDSDLIAGSLKEHNLELVPFKECADAYIVNTCTVTGKTDYQSRQLIRRAKRLNPSAILIVTGCYAQVAYSELTEIEGVDYILGNLEMEKILHFLKKDKRDSPLVSVGDLAGERPLLYDRAVAYPTRTKAYLKIQDGCNSFCSFCIIPYARGRSRSLPQKRVFEEMDHLMEKGFKEVILTGIHLGSYGADLPNPTGLTGLLKEMVRRSYPCRVRLSSLEPGEITHELVDFIGESDLLCHHLHISLQSGDDSLLSRMNRSYRATDFKETVEKLHRSIPFIAIGIDLIAGFPGEDDENFLNTVSLLKDLPLAYFHVFPFSRRKGTPAADFPLQVEKKVIKERAGILRELGEEKRMGFYRNNRDRVENVLIETTSVKGSSKLKGLTKNYIPLLIHGDNTMKGKEIAVRLGNFLETENRVYGKPVREENNEK